MLKDGLTVEELIQSETAPKEERASDSSRMLLGLMALARRAQSSDGTAGSIPRDLLRSLLSALHYRDISTLRHCRRTAQLAAGFANHLRWDKTRVQRLEIAALLHDVGKIGVPDNVLYKPGRLQSDEAGLMALHRNIGLDMLQVCGADRELIEIVARSQGRPEGECRRNPLADGPNEAHVLAVADAYDSLCTDQVFREALSHEEAMALLEQAEDARFEAGVVRKWGRWIETEGAALIEAEGDPAAGFPAPDPTEAGSLCSVFSYLYVLESLYDGFYLVDADMRFVIWNAGAQRLLGYAADEMAGRIWTCGLLRHTDMQGEPLVEKDYPLKRVVAGGRGMTQQVRIERPDGRWVEVESQTVPLLDRNGTLHGVAEIFRDLSRVRYRTGEFEELKAAAARDPLTSLANRTELESQLTQLYSEYSPEIDDPFSVIFLDIDEFKSINEQRGFGSGDQVLVEVARLLEAETYSGELVCRFGGEEFVLLCPDTDLEHAMRRAERLRTAIARAPISALDGEKISATFGVAQIEEGDTGESVLERADEALRRAKEKGYNRILSLTRAQCEGGPDPDEIEDTNADPFMYEGRFEACIAADMIVYKLGGFVKDHKAKIKQVTPNRARLQMGSRGLLGFWGSADDAQPVELVIEFGEQQGSKKQRRGAAKYVDVRVTIRPRGWIRNSQVFSERAKRVMKLLRSYFVVG
jgi:diguanylate cyclase (GGDEF)-like protein/PAS domain S-box-containing protein/putative nucleotidyltransferase with HDIG domain